MNPDRPEQTTGPVTGRIVAFITNYNAAVPLPGLDRHVARAFANWLACTVGGSGDGSVSRLLGVMDRVAGNGAATAIGCGRRMDMASAAFVNGFASNVLDFDDMHVPTLIHPTGTVVAAALAMAEVQRATGRALLDAVAIGIEVELHVGRCLFPGHYDQGWHITATAGVIGAAAAASALLGLDREATARALAMAATQAAGLRAMLPNEGKNLNVGKAARDGVMAALLADAGLTSAPAVFDDAFGYFSTFPPVDGYQALLGELGQKFLITEISLKPYPCGVVIHPVIDACLAIARRDGFVVAGIRSVDIHVHPRTAVLAEKQDPASAITSRFSLHHAATLALTFGNADFATFERASVADPDLAALRQRITVHRDDDLPQTQARVTIDLGAAGVVTEHVTRATGGPGNPLSDAQLGRKFVQLCRRAMDDAAAEALYARCLTLSEEPDIAAFMETVATRG